MTVIKVGSLKELASLIPKHQKARQRRIENAIRRTARKGVAVVKGNVPVAFGELREDIEAKATEGGAKIFLDAPHAAAIEVGSRPHWVPLEALVKWVRLRGMQGLASTRQLARLPGRSTFGAARSVQKMLNEHMQGLTGENHTGDSVAADAPLQVARAIQRAIAARGTKPHHYMRESQAGVYKILDQEIRAVLPEKEK